MHLVDEEERAVIGQAEFVLGVHEDESTLAAHLRPPLKSAKAAILHAIPEFCVEVSLLDDFPRLEPLVVTGRARPSS
jgi:hypothetical protein